LSTAAIAAIVGGVLACLCILCAAGTVAALTFRRARGSLKHTALPNATPARTHSRSHRANGSDSRSSRRFSAGAVHRA
jgi:hypothetical protein